MAKSLPISATKSFFIETRNTLIKGVMLAGAAATSVLEIFDGVIDAIATWTLINNGTGYAVGDLVTLVAGENGSSGSRAVFRVTQIDNLSPSSSISTSASSSISPSPSFTSVSSSPSTSISSSPSPSASRSTSISSSPSPSASVSTSISSSPSPSASRSTSLSSSPSTSISSSISSSRSSSASPSAGAGEITAIELISAGGGYTAGNTYATTSNGSGVNATIKADTVEDPSTTTSVAKLQCVANESAPPIESYCGIITTKGISARISGASAKGHLVYE